MTKFKATIVSIGEVVWDIYPDGKRLGGAPANFAYFCACLGFPVGLISQVGEDPLGELALKRLKEVGVKTDYISVSPDYPTGQVNIQLDQSGKPAFFIRQNASWDFIPKTEVLKELATITDVVYYGSLGSRSRVSAATINDFLSAVPPQCLKVFDINIRQQYYHLNLVTELLRHADILKLSSDELPVLARLFSVTKKTETAQLDFFQKQFQLDLIILTQGSKGSRLFSPTADEQFPGIQQDIIKDTVGAGDAFTATVVCGLLRNRPLSQINRHANQIASYVCAQEGAMPELPESVLDYDFK